MRSFQNQRWTKNVKLAGDEPDEDEQRKEYEALQRLLNDSVELPIFALAERAVPHRYAGDEVLAQPKLHWSMNDWWIRAPHLPTGHTLWEPDELEPVNDLARELRAACMLANSGGPSPKPEGSW